jgi:ATP-dependent helicase YprA (DUF1998 family)
MSSYEPIDASLTILDSVERYLKSSFNPRRASVARDFERAISEGRNNKEIGGSLFREVRRKFASGASLKDLANQGVIHPDLLKFTDFGLYAHQSKALELVSGSNRNVIIATGTGSGKTESFLIPRIRTR